MKEILPAYGVEVVEIPRFQQAGKAVSASLVRQYLEEKRMDLIKEIVPLNVYLYICEKWS